MLCLFFPHIMNSSVKKLDLFSLFYTVKYIGPIKIIYISITVFLTQKEMGKTLRLHGKIWPEIFLSLKTF